MTTLTTFWALEIPLWKSWGRTFGKLKLIYWAKSREAVPTESHNSRTIYGNWENTLDLRSGEVIVC